MTYEALGKMALELGELLIPAHKQIHAKYRKAEQDHPHEDEVFCDSKTCYWFTPEGMQLEAVFENLCCALDSLYQLSAECGNDNPPPWAGTEEDD